MSKIRFAVVGCGIIGKRHAAIIAGHPDCQLVGLCDIGAVDELGLSGYIATGIPFFDDIHALLSADIQIDVVCVCTPNGLHAVQSKWVLLSGRHVVVEKPMGLNKAECETVIHTALNVGKQVFCVMQNRYTPAAQWLKKLIENDTLGRIDFIQLNCFWNRDNRYYTPNGKPHPWKGTLSLDGGTLFTQFSHFIDTLFWVFGDIEDISAAMQNFAHHDTIEFEDTGVVLFRLVNGGGIGSLNYCTAVWGKNMESSISVIGSRGSIKISGQYMNEVVYCHIDDYIMPELPPSAPPNQYEGYTGSAANHHFVFQNVVDTLQGKAATATNALEGMKVVDMIERMYQAAK